MLFLYKQVATEGVMYKAMYKAFIKKVKFYLAMSLSMCKDFIKNVNFKTFSHLKHLMPMNLTFIKTVNFKNCFTSYMSLVR